MMVFRLPNRCALAFLSVGACTIPLPGEEVGTYMVQMSLTENTCGDSAINSLDGHRYKAQLRAKDGRGYWRIPGQKAMEGSYDNGHFQFSYDSVVASSAPDAGMFCQLIQTERLSGDVVTAGDAGAPDAASVAADAGRAEGLTGEHVMTISAAAQTDCVDALTPIGPFKQLPCEVRYKLTGEPTGSF